MVEIREISAAEALGVRHRVLWPDKPADFCRVDGDDHATHLGGFVEGKLCTVLSLFDEGETVQLRKFATLPAMQGKGLGSALMKAALDDVADRGKRITLHAREGAVGFYQSFGFQQQGAPFEKYGKPYIWMAESNDT